MPKKVIRNRALEFIASRSQELGFKGAASAEVDEDSSGDEAKSDEDEPDAKKRKMELPVHKATCDSPYCDGEPIRGIRYKCLQCEDYDLCENCLLSGVHDQHLFLRIPTPDQTKTAQLISVRPCLCLK